MTDPRSTPDPQLLTENTPAQIAVPVAELLRTPGGKRERQLICGDGVNILGRMDGDCLLRAEKDGYCGWVNERSIGPVKTLTHRVTARSTHIYSAPDMKSEDRCVLSFGSTLCAVSETATFIETPDGFVPRQHVHPIGTVATDPAAVAEIFLGVPYLWGGNSFLGIDCSGLVQAACLACDIPCPGDSDQQAAVLGAVLENPSQLRRNDLIFWKGHVALVSDPETIIHANAGHMAVVLEPLHQAVERIEAQGDGQPTGFRRLPATRGFND